MNYCILNIILIFSLNDVLGSLNTTNETNTIDGTNNTDVNVTYTIPTTLKTTPKDGINWKRRCLMIDGFNKTETNQVDLKGKLVNFFRERMKIRVNSQEVRFVRRLGKNNETKLKPIMMIVNSTVLKDVILQKRKKLIGTGVKINVHLPRGLRERHKLMITLKDKLRAQGHRVKAHFGRIYNDRKKLSKLKHEHLLEHFTMGTYSYLSHRKYRIDRELKL